MIYALISPAGKVIAETVSHEINGAQANAFDYLYQYKWAKPYWNWKKCGEFVAERTRRRWFVRELIVDVGGVVDK